jgi:hypothetical protein
MNRTTGYSSNLRNLCNQYYGARKAAEVSDKLTGLYVISGILEVGSSLQQDLKPQRVYDEVVGSCTSTLERNLSDYKRANEQAQRDMMLEAKKLLLQKEFDPKTKNPHVAKLYAKAYDSFNSKQLTSIAEKAGEALRGSDAKRSYHSQLVVSEADFQLLLMTLRPNQFG